MADDPHRCEYVVPRKKRQCRMLTKKGNQFCGEHLVHDPNNSTRIVCPNDSSHTVKQKDLEDHLKRCNARLPEAAWIRKDEFRRPDDEEINAVVKLIDAAYEAVEKEVVHLPARSFYEQHMKAEAERSQRKDKQLVQFASIIDHLNEHDLLRNSDDSLLIDLGSGKAQLIYWMTKCAPDCNYLLIDRMGTRNKFDRKGRPHPKLKITRLLCSIEHLDMSKVPIVEKCKDQATIVCKHFCGNATDAGIRCIENGIQSGVKFVAFALIPCCHHKCTFEEFVGREFLETVGIKTAADFSALRHVSTWATCKFPDLDPSTATGQLNAKKLEWGRRAKRTIEVARAAFLRTLGYRVQLYEYVDAEISPENLLILGERIQQTAD
ncbi:TRNA:m(4)X modification enzyme TRM13 [Aphelenchoides fujianensis]|nr:TRNA:m(4)X modification enzyme TRM13 [Aphelenchoides fujianensis]